MYVSNICTYYCLCHYPNDPPFYSWWNIGVWVLHPVIFQTLIRLYQVCNNSFILEVLLEHHAYVLANWGTGVSGSSKRIWKALLGMDTTFLFINIKCCFPVSILCRGASSDGFIVGVPRGFNFFIYLIVIYMWEIRVAVIMPSRWLWHTILTKISKSYG